MLSILLPFIFEYSYCNEMHFWFNILLLFAMLTAYKEIEKCDYFLDFILCHVILHFACTYLNTYTTYC